MREKLQMFLKSGRGPIWSFLNEFDEIFGLPLEQAPSHAAGSLARKENSFRPLMEITELKNAYVLIAELTGVRREDLQVELAGRKLTISGVRNPSHQFQWAYGRFSRTIILPENVDLEKIEAILKDGVLRVTMPKLATDKRRAIPVHLFVSDEMSRFGQNYIL